MSEEGMEVGDQLKTTNSPISVNSCTGADTAVGPTVIVTGSIAPYTNRLYEAVAEDPNFELHVLTCVDLEPRRKWVIGSPRNYSMKVLRGLRYHATYVSNVYLNPFVLFELYRLKPRIICISDFSPTMILAGLYALVTRTPLVIMTDGAVALDPGRRSRIHRAVRKFIVPRGTAAICASDDSVKLLAQYGLDQRRCIIVPISPGWPALSTVPDYDERPFDVIFCGSIDDETKGVMFFIDVLERCKLLGHSLKVRIVGDGPLKELVARRIEEIGLEVHFDGYLQQQDLPAAYASAKLLLFPSRGDVWGLVANEAIQAGTPVIGSTHAVSSFELVERFGIGRRCPLDVDIWAREIVDTLSQRGVWDNFSAGRAAAVQWFALDRAVEAFHKALRIAQSRCPC